MTTLVLQMWLSTLESRLPCVMIPLPYLIAGEMEMSKIASVWSHRLKELMAHEKGRENQAFQEATEAVKKEMRKQGLGCHPLPVPIKRLFSILDCLGGLLQKARQAKDIQYPEGLRAFIQSFAYIDEDYLESACLPEALYLCVSHHLFRLSRGEGDDQVDQLCEYAKQVERAVGKARPSNQKDFRVTSALFKQMLTLHHAVTESEYHFSSCQAAAYLKGVTGECGRVATKARQSLEKLEQKALTLIVVFLKNGPSLCSIQEQCRNFLTDQDPNQTILASIAVFPVLRQVMRVLRQASDGAVMLTQIAAWMNAGWTLEEVEKKGVPFFKEVVADLDRYPWEVPAVLAALAPVMTNDEKDLRQSHQVFASFKVVVASLAHLPFALPEVLRALIPFLEKKQDVSSLHIVMTCIGHLGRHWCFHQDDLGRLLDVLLRKTPKQQGSARDEPLSLGDELQEFSAVFFGEKCPRGVTKVMHEAGEAVLAKGRSHRYPISSVLAQISGSHSESGVRQVSACGNSGLT